MITVTTGKRWRMPDGSIARRFNDAHPGEKMEWRFELSVWESPRRRVEVLRTLKNGGFMLVPNTQNSSEYGDTRLRMSYTMRFTVWLEVEELVRLKREDGEGGEAPTLDGDLRRDVVGFGHSSKRLNSSGSP